MPASVRDMNATHVPASSNQFDVRSAGSVGAAWYWFSYVYYGSPAALVEQEVRTT